MSNRRAHARPEQYPHPYAHGEQPPDGYGYAERPRMSWHLEKGVSIGIILTLLVQIAGFGVCAMKFVWFASEITKQVAENSVDIAVMKVDEKDREKTRTEMLTTMSGIKQELVDMRELMIQSAGRATQLVMPQTVNGNPPTINIQSLPPSVRTHDQVPGTN